MPALSEVVLNKKEANTFLSRKLLANTVLRLEELSEGSIEKECREQVCSYEEAREVYEDDVDSLKAFWASYNGLSSSTTDNDNPVGLILGIVFGSVGLVIVVILSYVLWKRNKGELDKSAEENFQPYNPYPLFSYYSRRGAAEQTNNDYESPLLDTLDSDLAEGLSECFIERERLQLGRLITSGNFGEIRKGKLRMRDQSIATVAVKSLKSLDDPEDVEKFLREGVMMRGLKHDYVLALIGVCVDSSVEERRTSPLIVLPFMSNGDLRSYLRDGNNVLTVLDLIRFCHQVALGMEYLSEKKFVHRDLAARNCMVDDECRVKVADFGLSRDLFDRDYYKSSVKTQLPLKWMPPESIRYGKYDEKSDVWSFGIVCWEILTRGAIPYPTVEAVNILTYLAEGNRMERPDCCPVKLYISMCHCWLDDPGLRPSFRKLSRSTNDFLQEAVKASKRRRRKEEQRVSGNWENQEKSSNATTSKAPTENRPKPKPRASLRAKSSDRVDKYVPKENGKRKEEKRREKDSSSSSNVATISRGLDVGDYNDTPREISV